MSFNMGTSKTGINRKSLLISEKLIIIKSMAFQISLTRRSPKN